MGWGAVGGGGGANIRVIDVEVITSGHQKLP